MGFLKVNNSKTLQNPRSFDECPFPSPTSKNPKEEEEDNLHQYFKFNRLKKKKKIVVILPIVVVLHRYSCSSRCYPSSNFSLISFFFLRQNLEFREFRPKLQISDQDLWFWRKSSKFQPKCFKGSFHFWKRAEPKIFGHFDRNKTKIITMVWLKQQKDKKSYSASSCSLVAATQSTIHPSASS